MWIYNLIKHNDNHSKTFVSLWKYCKYIPDVNNNGNVVEFNGANTTDSFNFKTKVAGKTDNNEKIDNADCHNYFHIYNQILKNQLAGINTYQNQNYFQKTKFESVIWTKFSRSK